MSKLKRPRITLSVRGRIMTVCNLVNGSTADKFDYGNALFDSFIIAGMSFFTTLTGSLALGNPLEDAVKTAVVAAGSQFFLFLALKRGLVQKEEKK